MIYKATKLIKQEMDKQELNSSINEYEKSSNVVAGYNIQNGPYIQVDFISSDDDNDVAVRVFGFINHVAEDKEEKILKVINECHAEYRYLKFVLDEDGDVNIEYDFPVKLDDATVGVVAYELFVRCVKIAEKCYPMFMKAIWG